MSKHKMTMKLISFGFLILGSIHFAPAQNPYDVDVKSENRLLKAVTDKQTKREVAGKCKFKYTFEFQEGDRFIFEKSETAIRENWEMQWYFLAKETKRDEYRRTKLLHKDYGGKIVKIVKVEERKGIVFPDTYITFDVEGSGEQISLKTMTSRQRLKEQIDKSITKEQIYTLPYLIYLPEIDSFKENYLNKNVYTKFLSHDKQYQKVKITKVGAGSDRAPIRVVFESINGNQDYKDVCTCGSNLSSSFIELNYFENWFTSEDPRISFIGNDEIWDLITLGKIKLGMTEAELILSWGPPKTINETVVSGRASKQYVYYDQYVYVDNGIVSSFQSSK